MRELPSMNPLPAGVIATGQLLTDLHDYAGTAQMRTLDALLEQIEGEYLERLRTVEAEGLQWLQGALAQVTEIRGALAGRSDGRA